MSLVLEHGNTYKTTTCEHCGAKIAFGDADVESLLMMDINWCETYIAVVRCPECKHLTDADKIGNMIARGIYEVTQ